VAEPTLEERVAAALKSLPRKPADEAERPPKQAYSQKMSEKLALAFAEELRALGLVNARPAPPGELDTSGAERRMAGGIGAKNVDVTWATEESGLLLGISIKTINFRDNKTKNFQKNLINRRGDMLMEAVTLHRRFPYAVLAGFFFLDAGAEKDDTGKRRSTFVNAHARLRLFTGRNDPAGRDEQFERLYLALVDAAPPFQGKVRVYEVGNPGKEVPLSQAFGELMTLVAERNPDFYECLEGKLIPVPG
jgi:hypothetical protein